MSARHTEITKAHRALAVLSARLAIASAQRPKTLEEIVSDAERLRRAAANARLALETGRSPRAAHAKVRRIAERYDAIVLTAACERSRPLVLLFLVGPLGAEFSVS